MENYYLNVKTYYENESKKPLHITLDIFEFVIIGWQLNTTILVDSHYLPIKAILVIELLVG